MALKVHTLQMALEVHTFQMALEVHTGDPLTGASSLPLDLSIDWSIKSTTGAPNLSLDPSIDWSINICHGLLKPPWGLTVGVLRVLMTI
jgi:hypothetical protein